MNCLFQYERVTGIEPVYRAWQARIITTILYPQIYYSNVVQVGVEPTCLAAQHFKCCVYTSSTTGPSSSTLKPLWR